MSFGAQCGAGKRFCGSVETEKLSLRSALPLAIIGHMRWDECQAIYLKAGKEIGAKLNLNVELLEPGACEDDEVEIKPTAVRRRWFIFWRRARLRELRLAFDRSDDPTPLHFIYSFWVPVDRLDQPTVADCRPDFEESVREFVKGIEDRRGN
jgi:hypothetical protein